MNCWTRLVFSWFPRPWTPKLLGRLPCLPWQSRDFSLCPVQVPLLSHASELLFRTLTTLSPNLAPSTIQRWPARLFAHIYHFLHQRPSPHTCLCHSFSAVSEKEMSFFLCIWYSSHPVLSDVEQTDLDLNPCSKILLLLPASLLPECGKHIVIIGNCKFQHLCNYYSMTVFICPHPCSVPWRKSSSVTHSVPLGRLPLPEKSPAALQMEKFCTSFKIMFKRHANCDTFLQYHLLHLNPQTKNRMSQSLFDAPLTLNTPRDKIFIV